MPRSLNSACIVAFIILTSGSSSCFCYNHHRKDVAWSTWSHCSVTCGTGTQTRVRGLFAVENRPCVLKFCPSYMDWPRLHFHGRLAVDPSSLNNMRCNYNSKHFTIAGLSKFTAPQLIHEKNSSFFGTFDYNWNPMGSGHLYFLNTHVSTICTSPYNCSNHITSIFKETERAQIVMPDPDRQTVSEIWGLTIQVPGVFQAKYRPASTQRDGKRATKLPMGRFKSKLENITWHNEHYKTLFRNSRELSINMVIDAFNYTRKSGRLTGTVGMTSLDDPNEQTSTRILQSTYFGCLHAPFYHYKDKHVLTIDISASLPSYRNKTIKTRNLYVALAVSCRFPYVYPNEVCSQIITTTSGKTFFLIDLISKYMDVGEKWYTLIGGIIDISTAHLSKGVEKLFDKHKIAVIRKDVRSTHVNYKISLEESKFGINIGVLNSMVKRLNVGQSTTYPGFVSQYGNPVQGANLQVEIAPAMSQIVCTFKACETKLSQPEDALLILNKLPTTNGSGMNDFMLTAVKDPNVKRCGIDGQLYVMAVHLKYRIAGKTYVFTNSDVANHGSYYNLLTIRPVVRIFNKIPVKKCPGWLDVQDIFLQYYNLYPVMARHGIIDLHSYTDVKRKARMLRTAMFEYEFGNSKYMPASRDLSLSKQELIWNWMECGMQFDTSTPNHERCSAEQIKSGKEEILQLLQNAVEVELATIPPYFTALLSLKTEESRNLEIAKLIKSIYTEEMLHMSLAGNILNAVGGTVNLTNMNRLPTYPISLGSGTFYSLGGESLVPLQKFSISLARDVFTNIEKPSPPQVQKKFLKMAAMWKLLGNEDDFVPSSKMRMLLADYEALEKDKDEAVDTKNDSQTESELGVWHGINRLAYKLMKPESKLSKTIGDLYVRVLTQITYLESCLQIESIENREHTRKTLFIGEPRKQLNMSQWYNPVPLGSVEENTEMLARQMNREKLSSNDDSKSFILQKDNQLLWMKNRNLTSPLFPVYDLKTAIQAVIEIVYQGEGGSPCSMFRESPLGENLSYQKSHYAKFWEIVRGRKLKLIDISEHSFSPAYCLNTSDYGCHVKQSVNKQLCFVGDEIPFDEDGVWPILTNPGPFTYPKNTLAYELDHQFNLQYTRLLWCLQGVFNGHPHMMKNCMSFMYDLILTGKQVVATPIKRKWPIRAGVHEELELHATPTWLFVRESDYRAGLNLQV